MKFFHVSLTNDRIYERLMRSAGQLPPSACAPRARKIVDDAPRIRSRISRHPKLRYPMGNLARPSRSRASPSGKIFQYRPRVTGMDAVAIPRKKRERRTKYRTLLFLRNISQYAISCESLSAYPGITPRGPGFRRTRAGIW